jgi:ABC-type lipoprotein release transport system permease subunit
MGAWALTRALAASLYEVSATDPTVFTIVASALGVIALMAAWLPAQRAAGLEPLAALRAE